jgi:hypothetical protein
VDPAAGLLSDGWISSPVFAKSTMASGALVLVVSLVHRRLEFTYVATTSDALSQEFGHLSANTISTC